MIDALLIIIATMVIAAAVVAFGAVLFWGADQVELGTLQTRPVNIRGPAGRPASNRTLWEPPTREPDRLAWRG